MKTREGIMTYSLSLRDYIANIDDDPRLVNELTVVESRIVATFNGGLKEFLWFFSDILLDEGQIVTFEFKNDLGVTEKIILEGGA